MYTAIWNFISESPERIVLLGLLCVGLMGLGLWILKRIILGFKFTVVLVLIASHGLSWFYLFQAGSHEAGKGVGLVIVSLIVLTFPYVVWGMKRINETD